MRMLACPSCERCLVVDVTPGTLLTVILHEPVVTYGPRSPRAVPVDLLPGVSPSCNWWLMHGEDWLAGVLVGDVDPTVSV